MFYSNYCGCYVENGAELGRDSKRRAGRQDALGITQGREIGGLGQSWVLSVRIVDIWAQISPGFVGWGGGGTVPCSLAS